MTVAEAGGGLGGGGGQWWWVGDGVGVTGEWGGEGWGGGGGSRGVPPRTVTLPVQTSRISHSLGHPF